MIADSGEGGQDSCQGSADRRKLLHIPGQELRQLEKGQGLTRGRAVHDDAVVPAPEEEVADLEQGKEVFQSGNHITVPDLADRHPHAAGKIGNGPVDMGIFLPHEQIRVQFEHRQAGADLLNVSSGPRLKNIPEVVSHIRADEEGIPALRGTPHGMGSRHAGLSDASFSGDNKNTGHVLLLQKSEKALRPALCAAAESSLFYVSAPCPGRDLRSLSFVPRRDLRKLLRVPKGTCGVCPVISPDGTVRPRLPWDDPSSSRPCRWRARGRCRTRGSPRG